MEVMIESTTGTPQQVQMMITERTCTGDISYKDFDLSTYLIPPALSYKLVFLDPSSYHHDTLTIDLHPVDSVITAIAGKQSQTVPGEGSMGFEITDLLPVYSEKDRENFYHHLSTIDEYYASSENLDSVKNVLSEVNFTSLPITQHDLIRLTECENILHHLVSKKLDFASLTSGSDPAGFLSKLDKCSEAYNLSLGNLRLLADGSGKSPSGFSVSGFSNGYTGFTVKYINRSYDAGFYLAPYYQSLAGIQITNARLLLFQSVAEEFGQQAAGFRLPLINSLCKSWINIADSMIGQQLYNDVFIILDNADRLCRLVIRANCQETIIQLKTDALEGIFNSYLSLAIRFFQISNIEMSEEYLRKAHELLTSNPGYAIPDEALAELVRAHIAIYHETGDGLIEKNDKEGAVVQYIKSISMNSIYLHDRILMDSLRNKLLALNEEIYQHMLTEWRSALEREDFTEAGYYAAQAIAYTESNLPDTIYKEQALGVIRQIREYNYMELLHESAHLIQWGDVPGALEKLQEAADLASLFGIPEPPLFNELLSQAWKPILLEKLSKGRMHMWLNDIDLAEDVLNECIETAQRYKLEKDPELSAALDDLRLKISDKKKFMGN
jgi:tetratricopeptide (TPR) repeat protein